MTTKIEVPELETVKSVPTDEYWRNKERALLAGFNPSGTPWTAAEILELCKEAVTALARKEAYAESLSVTKLSSGISAKDLLEARHSGAVRVGEDIYTPIDKSGHFVFPSLFARSNLFCAFSDKSSKIDSERRSIHTLEGKAKLDVFAPTLSMYDRRVFAACLHLFKDRPLTNNALIDEFWTAADESPSDYVEITAYKLLKMMSVNPGSASYKPLIDSLKRLASVKIEKISYKNVDLNLRRLIVLEIPGIDPGAKKVDASTKLRIAVPQEIGPLLVESRWLALPSHFLKEEGLVGWLGAFLRSHSKPYLTKITRLQKLSGCGAWTKPKFKAALDRAIAKLTDYANPAVQIDSCHFQDDSVEITLKRWVRVSSKDKAESSKGAVKKAATKI